MIPKETGLRRTFSQIQKCFKGEPKSPLSTSNPQSNHLKETFEKEIYVLCINPTAAQLPTDQLTPLLKKKKKENMAKQKRIVFLSFQVPSQERYDSFMVSGILLSVCLALPLLGFVLIHVTEMISQEICRQVWWEEERRETYFFPLVAHPTHWIYHFSHIS